MMQARPGVAAVISRFKLSSKIEFYNNTTNLGFTNTVNRGLSIARGHDVILLNSDTVVTPRWVQNLRLAAYSGERVGTVTPLSNNAGAFSAPDVGQDNKLPSWLSLDYYARAITQVARRSYPRAPTGNGFCMYIRHDCLLETGVLDAEAFPRGYGEENDFCMRAGRLGWAHVIDDSTLIYHVRSASFGEAKNELMKRGREIIDRRYPDYTSAVRALLADEKLKQARDRVREVALAITPGKVVKPRILYVLSTITGGTPQTNQDLMSVLDDRVETFVLRSNSRFVLLFYFAEGVYQQLDCRKLSHPIRPFPHRSEEYDAIVAEWLVRYSFELIHIRHLAWHGLGLVNVASHMGIPIVFSFHDFYTVCPTVKLLDHGNVYCHGKCTAGEGECKPELWSDRDFYNLSTPLFISGRSSFSLSLRSVMHS